MKDRNPMSAEIVAVGTEILLGSLLDTNTAWLSRRLAALGVGVYRHTTVGDNKGRLVAALSEAAARADIVISTGGLGPTFDDLTNEALGQATGREMIEYSVSGSLLPHVSGRRGVTCGKPLNICSKNIDGGRGLPLSSCTEVRG